MPYKSVEDSKAQKKAYYQAYGKIEYHARKRAHMCTYCGKQDAYTLAGRHCCYECAERRREKYEKGVYERRKEEKLKKWKEKYESRKEQGLCPRCGRKAARGKTWCERCLAKRRKGAAYIPEGYCTSCKKNLAMDGRKLCERCYKAACENLTKGRKKNGYWVAENRLIFTGGQNSRGG